MPFRRRLALSLAIGAGAGLLSYALTQLMPGHRDFGQVWYAAGAVLDGENPYALIGPGRPFQWPWPFYYPLPAAIIVLPLAWLTEAAAMGVFAAVGAGLFAWALMEHGRAPLLAFVSGVTLYAVQYAQWTPAMAAALVLPWASLVAVAKPNIGLALFIARPSRWAVIGALVFGGLAFAVQPHWLQDWIAALESPNVMPGKVFLQRAPVTIVGGFVALLALARWRRPEARLLVALACVPQTLSLYHALPLFLIPRGRRESAVLAGLSTVMSVYVATRMEAWPTFSFGTEVIGRAMLLCMYFPCTLMVLRRPNEGDIPAWLDQRIAAWPAWLRGAHA